VTGWPLLFSQRNQGQEGTQNIDSVCPAITESSDRPHSSLQVRMPIFFRQGPQESLSLTGLSPFC
jgi:hypothetical protein